ncbi:MAG: DUF541 domain-containing protein [Rhizobiales bacterium]|nr:DUF541 domain-containing protein [Hyphomicrobiales bacterium]
MQLTARALLLALAVTVVPVAAAGQQPLERGITVIGEGTANVVPDLAVIQAGVTTQGRTAREASEANSTTMAKVHAALKAAGIGERDAQTAHFSIRPVYDTRRDGDNRITGFQASNQISARVRAVAEIATVLDQMIAAGANDISGIHFTVSERSMLLDKARADAVADARRKAEQLARAAGVRLGRATVIVEHGGSPVPMERMTMRAAPAAAPPVAVGEQTLRVHVSVTFELLN